MRGPAAAVILIAAMLPLVLAGTTFAESLEDPLENGVKAYERGDADTAYRLLAPLAEQGESKAQLYIGIMHEKGHGVRKESLEAVWWYRKAAEQGNDQAQNNLGVMYRNGQGVKQDYEEAMNWFRKAEEQGNPDALFNLGIMYDEGKGVERDYYNAYVWFDLATLQYPASEGAKRKKAITRRDRAASNGKLTADQIAEAQRMAREWKPKKEK